MTISCQKLGLQRLWNPALRVSRVSYAGVTSRLRRMEFATNAHIPPEPTPRSGYPERLLVYHAGTGRTVFIGCMKITTIMLFSFSCFVLSPLFYLAPEYPGWAPFAAVALGAIPMIFVTYTTAPFVSFVHIKVPSFARRSRAQLSRWIQEVPKSTEIDLTTMRFAGRARVTRLPLSDLKPTKARLGVANLAKISRLSTEPSKPWWMGKELNLFYVANENKSNQESKIWQTSSWQKAMWQLILNRIQHQ